MSSLILPSRRSLILGAGAAFIAKPVLGLTPGQKSAIAKGALYYNFNGRNLEFYKAGLAARAAGTRNTKWLAFGDSSFTGFGTGTGGTFYTNCRARGWTAQLAAMFPSASISSQNANNLIGAPATVPLINPTIAFDSTWSTVATATLGGYAWQSATDQGTATFTPTNNVDTFVIVNINTGGNSMKININGGSTLASVGGSGSTVTFTTVTATLGSNTLNLVNQGTTTSYVCYVEAYNSAVKEITVRISGMYAQTSTFMSNNTGQYAPLALLSNNSMVGDLVWMENGLINDGGSNPISLALSATNNEKIFNAIQPKASIIVVDGQMSDGPPLNTVDITLQTAFRNQLLELAYDFNLPFISVRNFIGQYNGNLYADQFHLNYASQTRVAGLIYPAMQLGFSAP